MTNTKDNQWKVEWSDQVKDQAEESPEKAEALRAMNAVVLKAAQEFQAGLYPNFGAALMAQKGVTEVERLEPDDPDLPEAMFELKKSKGDA